jgi:hypothetical protein|tara:strand:+ start:78 stop:1064 length:987 start_codon:yes stop_codon:yes gene_type:complete
MVPQQPQPLPQQLHHRVKAPIIEKHRSSSAGQEKPLCSFYSREDDSFATYSSVTELLSKLANTSNDAIVASLHNYSHTPDPSNTKISQHLIHRILTDSNVCQSVSRVDKTTIINHVLQTSLHSNQAKKPTTFSLLLFVVLRMFVANECIRQEGWTRDIPLSVLENDDELLLSPDDAKEKSILKVFHQEAVNGATPPLITMESFSRELRIAENRIRLLSLQITLDNDAASSHRTSSGSKNTTDIAPLSDAFFTIDSFIDRTQVNLMEPLPKAAMKDKTPYSSLERPIQSPRAAEYLTNALKAMPNNSAIQDSLRKAIFHQEHLQKNRHR